MELLITLRERRIYLVQGGAGNIAVYYIVDDDAGGILINTPTYHPELAAQLRALAKVNYLFFPSRFGAQDVDRWREAEIAESLAYGAEARAISGKIDLVLDQKSKLTRTIDFLPMSGRTDGCCALRVRNLPGVVFFGPILTPGISGWPTLVAQEDDHSYEMRLIGSLGLQDIKYDYAFTDTFISGSTNFGPGADGAIQLELKRILEL